MTGQPKYLFDTNALSPLFDPQSRLAAHRQAVEGLVLSDGGVTTAAIVVYELRRGFAARYNDPTNQPSLRIVGALERLLSVATVLGLDWEQWRTASTLYGQATAAGRPLQEADLIVAATALANRRVLVTFDRPLADNLAALGVGAHVLLLPSAQGTLL